MSSPVSSQSADPTPEATLGNQRNQFAQFQQMRAYVAEVSSLFSQLLTEIVLEQPKDPHSFLIQSLSNMPMSACEELTSKLSAQVDGYEKTHNEEKNHNRAQDCLVVHTTLTFTFDTDMKNSALPLLKEMQKIAHAMSACKRFDIVRQTRSSASASPSPTHEVLIDSCWSASSGHATFQSNPDVKRIQSQLDKMLHQPTQEKTFVPL